MAQTRKSKLKLEVREERLKLKIVGKPYYEKLRPGLNLGYRRNQTDGAWCIRVSDGRGGSAIAKLGVADDYEPAGGKMNYWQAREAALAQRDTAGKVKVKTTVKKALDDYEAHLRNNRRDTRNVNRVRRHPGLDLDTPISALTQRDFRAWRDSIPGAISTRNRIVCVLRAALNLAAGLDSVVDRSNWQGGLETIKGGNSEARDRNVVLDDDTVRKIIAEAYRAGADFGLLVEVLAVTGTRYSQLQRCRVHDLDLGDRPKLFIPASKKGSSEKNRPAYGCAISPSLAARLASNRPPDDTLLLKASGEPWKPADQYERFRSVVTRLGLDPSEVSIYALRHTNITKQLVAGVPARIVAASHDTSVAQIEKTYSRNISDHADDLLRNVLLDVEVAA